MLSYFGVNVAPHDGLGLCNQFYNIMNGCMFAVNDAKINKDNVLLFLGKFSCQIQSNNVCNISEILNLKETNKNFRKHNVQLADINNHKIIIKKITVNKSKDITELVEIKGNIVSKKDLNKYAAVNDRLQFYFIVDDTNYDYDILVENEIKEDVRILDPYKCQMKHFPVYAHKDFEIYSKYFVFNDVFIDYPKRYLQQMQNTKLNCIHLRIDDIFLESIFYENMTKEDIKHHIENKYITQIKELINKEDLTFVLGEHYDNNIVKYLKDNEYNFVITEKIYDKRELNALNDLHVGTICNNVFIGNHESSFSGLLFYRSNAHINYLIQHYDT